jgi:hypothetical protein
MDVLDGRVAMITGWTSGIGAVTAAVPSLASDVSSFISGQELAIDGGILTGRPSAASAGPAPSNRSPARAPAIVPATAGRPAALTEHRPPSPITIGLADPGGKT